MRRILLAGALAIGVAAPLAAQPTVPETYGDAMRWYREAAEAGYPRAQFLLGYMHEIGERVERDLARARAWYAKAAAQGETLAEYRLARLYHHGLGGPADLDAATGLYRAAATDGHVGAQSALGYLYAVGDGVARDDVQAYFWLSLAAAAGDAAAAENLAAIADELSPEERRAGDALIEAWNR